MTKEEGLILNTMLEGSIHGHLPVLFLGYGEAMQNGRERVVGNSIWEYPGAEAFMSWDHFDCLF